MRKLSHSFRARLMMVIIIPLFLVSGILTVVVSVKMTSLMYRETEAQLKSADYALRSMIESLGTGPFSVKDGVLYDGEKPLDNMNQILDEFTSNSGLFATLFFGDTRISTSVIVDGQRPIGTQAATEVSSAVLSGKEFTSRSTPVAGMDCMVAYIPLYQPGSNEVCGMVFAGISKQNMVNQIRTMLIQIVSVAFILLAVVALLAIYVLNRLVKIILGVSRVCTELSDGDFTNQEAIDGRERNDELGQMVNKINILKKNFNKAISGVKDNITYLVENAEIISDSVTKSTTSMGDASRAVEEIANGATSQAQDVSSSAANVAKIMYEMENINQKIDSTNELSQKMMNNSNIVIENFRELLEHISSSVEKLDGVTEKMEHVKEAVDGVTTAAAEIDSIASQTNLLSLNASIEAARAGEAGKGFAVVATEIQQLSASSNESASHIKQIMSSLQTETDGAIKTIEEMNSIISELGDTSSSSRQSIRELIDMIDESKEMIADVKRESNSVQHLCSILNDAIGNLSAISQENAASTEETSASIQQIDSTMSELNTMADELKNISTTLDSLTAQFKLI